MADSMVHYSFPIADIKKDGGDLLVYGACTDGTVDSDKQIVDPGWSGKALQDWYESGGNVRVQHSPFLYPAGNGSMLEVNKDGDGSHWIQARVVEPTAKLLVEKGVLKDFSIGIMDPLIVHGDPRAPGGVIKGGFIGEVSLVDRGSNHNSGFKIAKSAAHGPAELVNKLYGKMAITPADMAKFLGKNGSNKDWSNWDQAHADAATRARGGTEDVHQQHLDHEVHNAHDAHVSAEHAAHDAHSAHEAHMEHEADTARPATPAKTSTPASASKPTAGQNEKDNQIMAAQKAGKPPWLNDDKGSDSDADGDSKEDNDKGKTCISCKTKNDAGAKRCSNCGKKLGMAIKADAAQDGSVTQDEEENEDEYAPADNDDKPKDKTAKKARKVQRLLKELGNAQRGNNGGHTPIEGFAPDPAGGKKMVPAGKHREPDGAQANGIEHDGGMLTNSEPGSANPPGSAWKALHDATCPHIKRKALRKSWGVDSINELMPVEALSAGALEAINKGDSDAAVWLTEVASGALSIREIPANLLMDARKLMTAFQGDFAPSGNVGHGNFTENVQPGMFQRGYVSSGHPELSAQGSRGNGLPNAPQHHVSASNFQRGALGAGHADASPGEGSQASQSTAIIGQAMTSMRRMHEQVSSTWPELCPGSARITQHDYTQGEGMTGLRPTPIGTVPHGTAIGEATIANKAFGGGNEADLRRKLAKAQRQLKELQRENEELGAQPDPFSAAFRGVPGLGGPVDRVSQIEKAAGGAPNEDDFENYLQGLARSGDPTMRANATKALTSLITK